VFRVWKRISVDGTTPWFPDSFSVGVPWSLSEASIYDYRNVTCLSSIRVDVQSGQATVKYYEEKNRKDVGEHKTPWLPTLYVLNGCFSNRIRYNFRWYVRTCSLQRKGPCLTPGSKSWRSNTIIIIITVEVLWPSTVSYLQLGDHELASADWREGEVLFPL